MSRFHFEPEGFSKDIAKCSRCSRVLLRHDYGFDELGRTLENCPDCGPMLLARRVGAPLPKYPERKTTPQILRGCLDCGGPMKYRGSGQRPVRCVECQTKRSRAGNLERDREKRERYRRLFGCR